MCLSWTPALSPAPCRPRPGIVLSAGRPEVSSVCALPPSLFDLPGVRGDIDHVVGYVDAKDLFQRVLNNQPISLADDSLVRKVLIVPDKLTLSEGAGAVPAGA